MDPAPLVGDCPSCTVAPLATPTPRERFSSGSSPVAQRAPSPLGRPPHAFWPLVVLGTSVGVACGQLRGGLLPVCPLLRRQPGPLVLLASHSTR